MKTLKIGINYSKFKAGQIKSLNSVRNQVLPPMISIRNDIGQKKKLKAALP
jgi:hypothetical protein